MGTTSSLVLSAVQVGIMRLTSTLTLTLTLIGIVRLDGVGSRRSPIHESHSCAGTCATGSERLQSGVKATCAANWCWRDAKTMAWTPVGQGLVIAGGCRDLQLHGHRTRHMNCLLQTEPSLVVMHNAAPCRNRSSTTARWRASTAYMSAVYPALFTISMLEEACNAAPL